MSSDVLSKDYWNKIVAPYKVPSVAKSVFQIVNTSAAFIAVCYLMYITVDQYYAVTLMLAVLGGFLLVRFFIIQHDCGHGSFFKSKKANDFVGRSLSVLTMTPYAQWAKEHNKHHATAGNLSNRGVGDVTTWTVEEYFNANKWNRFLYRVHRNPFFLFTLGALLHFMVKQRFPFYKTKRLSSWMSVMFTNLYMAAAISFFIWWIGAVPFLKIYAPLVLVASTVGTWVFYVQHQFEDAYWEKSDNWNYYDAAIKGSLYYRMPKIMHWLTGNIGYHHIHHLSSMVPNYNLPKCYRENVALQSPSSMGIWESRKSLRMALWDEEHKKMVSFKYCDGLAAN